MLNGFGNASEMEAICSAIERDRSEAQDLKKVVTEQSLELRLLKIKHQAPSVRKARDHEPF